MGPPRKRVVVLLLALASACVMPCVARAQGVKAADGEAHQVEGRLEVLYEEGPGGARLHHYLVTRTERLPLRFAKRPPRLSSGAKVRVKGVRVSGALAIGDADSVETLALASANTFGEQRTMVLLVNFYDGPAPPYSAAYAQDVVFNQASNFYRESSFQQTWLAGDVYGWFPLPVSVNLCDVNAIGTAAQQAAVAAGIDVYSYQRWVFAFPKNACSWLGFASLGGGTVYGSPSRAWINGPLNFQVAAHEIGHGFALWHAHAVGCTDGTTGIDFHVNCYRVDYGDTIDNMGYATGYWSAFNKEQIGWLNHGTSPPITTVQSPGGTYWIDTYETENGNPKGLKIARGDGSFFYVESRQAIGADAFLAGSSQALSGVFIRIATPGVGDSGVLYDMTPATTPWVFTDGALVVGQTLTDAASGVSITPLSVGAAGAVVMVSYGSTPSPCTPAPPEVTISPSETPIAPGGAASLAVSVTNHDSAACTASNFNLAAAVVPGWTATLGATVLTLIPGATASTTLDVFAPSSATAGSYPVSVIGTQAGNPGNGGAASATLVIEAPCVRAAPVVALLPAQAAIDPGGTAAFTVSVANNNSGACGVSSFMLAPAAPAGWTASLASPTLPVAPGATLSTTLSVTAPVSATSGSYGVSTTATESGFPGNSGSATRTITINVPLSVAVATDRASYRRGNTVRLTAIVTQGGAPAPSASVAFVIGFPGGGSTTLAKLTDGSGKAKASFKINSGYPLGVYSVTATATKSGLSGSSTTSFTVQ